jgi:hypothetical protein
MAKVANAIYASIDDLRREILRCNRSGILKSESTDGIEQDLQPSIDNASVNLTRCIFQSFIVQYSSGFGTRDVDNVAAVLQDCCLLIKQAMFISPNARTHCF